MPLEPGSEFGRLLVALDEGALHLALVARSRAGDRYEDRHENHSHGTSSARASRIEPANSSTARASAIRSSTERITVAAARTWMPSERMLWADDSSSRSITKPSMKRRYSPATE